MENNTSIPPISKIKKTKRYYNQWIYIMIPFGHPSILSSSRRPQNLGADDPLGIGLVDTRLWEKCSDPWNPTHLSMVNMVIYTIFWYCFLYDTILGGKMARWD
jgi:hypothetical protein